MDQAANSYFPQPYSAEGYILHTKCTLHPKYCCDLLDLSLRASTPRICVLCAQDFLIPLDKVLPIRQLLGSSSDSFLMAYPVLENMQLIREVQNTVGSIEAVSSQSQQFFVNLEATIQKSIEKAKNNWKNKIQQLAEKYQKTMNCYQKISGIEQFKLQLLANPQQDSSALYKYIEAHVKNAPSNTYLIETSLNEFKILNNQFSLKSAEQIKQNISKKLASLDLFQQSFQPNVHDIAVSPQIIGIEKASSKDNHQSIPNETCIKEMSPQSPQGIKIVQFKDGLYEGEVINSIIRQGYGKMTYLNGSTYQGEWKNNKFNGQGKFLWPDGAEYEGSWKDDSKNGKGHMFFPDGSKYDGDWKDDKREGHGCQYWPDQQYFIGEWKDDKKEGKGILYYPNGSRYEGEWRYGKIVSGQFFEKQEKITQVNSNNENEGWICKLINKIY